MGLGGVVMSTLAGDLQPGQRIWHHGLPWLVLRVEPFPAHVRIRLSCVTSVFPFDQDEATAWYTRTDKIDLVGPRDDFYVAAGRRRQYCQDKGLRFDVPDECRDPLADA